MRQTIFRIDKSLVKPVQVLSRALFYDMAGPTHFTIALQLEDSKTQTPVHFKVDGNRFGKDPDYSRTVKINNTIRYKATVTITPNVEHLR